MPDSLPLGSGSCYRRPSGGNGGEVTDTTQEQDLGARGAELLDRLSHGETFEIVKDGQTIGLMTPTAGKPTRTFDDWLMSAPRVDDLEMPDRSKGAMRGVDP